MHVLYSGPDSESEPNRSECADSTLRLWTGRSLGSISPLCRFGASRCSRSLATWMRSASTWFCVSSTVS